MIFRRFRVVVANMMIVDWFLVGFRCRVAEGIDYLGLVSLVVVEDVVELV